jgi:beta-lactamase regulating signal transducer with metallopeptidase domain
MNALIRLEGVVFEWVLQATWRGAVLAALILAAQWLLRRRLSPAWRHGLWLLLVLRLITPFSPRSAWSVFNLARIEPPSARGASLTPDVKTVPLKTDPTAAGNATEGMAQADPTAPRRRADLVGIPSTPAFSIQPSAVPSPPGIDWFALASAVWMAGTVWFGLRLFWLNWRFRSRVARLQEVSNPEVRRLLDECAALLGVRRRARLIETAEVESPALFGLGRQLLLLPEGIVARFSLGDLRHIFLHELAHLKRRDLEMNWLIEILRALHWFNPVLWFAFARMRADREMAADAAALSAAGGGDNTGYGETILKILEGLRGRNARPGVVGIAEDRTRMAERLRAIAGHGRTVPWGLAGAGAALALAAVGLTDQPASSRKAGVESRLQPQLQSASLPINPPPVSAAKTTSSSARSAELQQALKTLRECKSVNDRKNWEAEQVIQANINLGSTELLPDLIAIVRGNTNAGMFVRNAMNQYAVGGVLNRMEGMELWGQFEPYLHAPELPARLVGALGMAFLDRENAGSETLHAALEGLQSRSPETRRWAEGILDNMFRQFQIEEGQLAATQTAGILASMLRRQGREGVAIAPSISESEIQNVERALWADLARSTRDQLKVTIRDTAKQFWMMPDDNWALVQGRLGRALLEQANLTPGPEALRLLTEAADAYRLAMEDYTRTVSPAEWAWYEDSLGLVLRAQAERTKGSEAVRLLTEAVKAHRAALEGYPQSGWPNRRTRVSENLRRAEALLQKLNSGAKTSPSLPKSAILEHALKTLREGKSANDPEVWAAARCIQTNIHPASTELLPDLIAIVKANPKVGWQVQNALNQYAVWSLMNRQMVGMEYSAEFEPYLQLPELQGRLIAGYGMAFMDRESAGLETLHAAFEGLKSPNDETRRWAADIFATMFPGQFRFEGLAAVSNQPKGILARMFPQPGQRGFGAARFFSEAEVRDAQRTLWASLAESCRDRLPAASRDTSQPMWSMTEDNWAATQGRLGAALFEQAKLAPGPEAARLLAEAADAYHAAMEDYTRERCAPDWAWYEDNLGLVLIGQAEQSRGAEAARFVSEAVRAHRAALEGYPQSGWPNRRARVSEHLHQAEARL